MPRLAARSPPVAGRLMFAKTPPFNHTGQSVPLRPDYEKKVELVDAGVRSREDTR